MALDQYRKALVAAALQIITFVLLITNVDINPEILTGLDAVLTTLAVFLVRNAPR